MSNIVSYILDLKGNMSSTMQKIGVESGNVKSKLEQVKSTASGLSGIFKMVGISFGAFQIANMAKEGVEKVHALHQAQAQLANTMQNMGTYSEEAYNKAIKGAGDMAKTVKFSKSEIIDLQSRLRMVGNVGESEMAKMTMASADMATKFKTGLTEAGDAIAKSVNNPEMMRRLAMQLKIDPKTVDKIQKIAKAGNEAKARLMLIDVVQKKVGGSAQAAFNADPLARYNKTMGSIKTSLGEVVVNIQSKLAPVMEIISVVFQTGVKKITDAFGWVFDKLKSGDPVVTAITVTLGAFAAVIGTVTLFLKLWAAGQWLVNVAMSANPVGLIIAGIVALIALIAFLVIKVDGWGQTWNNVMTMCKLGFELFKASVTLIWLNVQDAFLRGFEVIEEGWYKVQSLWNEDAANAGLSKLEADRNARAKEIADAQGKVADIAKQMSNMEVIKLSVNDTSLSDVGNKLKNKIGISVPGIPGTNGAGGTIGGAISGSGSGGGAGKDTANSIATGGTKTTHITVNVGQMGNDMKVYVSDVKEGAEKIRDIVLDHLTRVLTMAQGQVA